MQGHPVGHLHHSQDRTPSFLPAQSCVGAEPTQPQFGSRALTGGGGAAPSVPGLPVPLRVGAGSREQRVMRVSGGGGRVSSPTAAGTRQRKPGPTG